MSHGRPFRLPLLGFLLIVVTIQGIVPDGQDLASMEPLRLFAHMLPGSDTFAQEDEWPDDVCDPVTSLLAAGNRRPASRRLDRGVLALTSTPRSFQSQRSRP